MCTHERSLKLVLDDIIVKRKEMSVKDLRYIIDICDGWSVQYKCGAALYSLTITTTTRKCIVFWCVKCPGHGKCRCDLEGGICKTRVDVHFNRFVALSGNSSDEVTVPIHHVQDGALLSLAEVVWSVLDVDEFRFGTCSQSFRRRESSRVIQERIFLIRERGQAWINIRMQAIGFDSGEHMELRAHHCFVADPDFKVIWHAESHAFVPSTRQGLIFQPRGG